MCVILVERLVLANQLFALDNLILLYRFRFQFNFHIDTLKENLYWLCHTYLLVLSKLRQASI